MTKAEIKRRLCKKIDEDDTYAHDIDEALINENDAWLKELIESVIGIIIDLASATWNWIKRQLS